MPPIHHHGMGVGYALVFVVIGVAALAIVVGIGALVRHAMRSATRPFEEVHGDVAPPAVELPTATVVASQDVQAQAHLLRRSR